MSGFRLRFPTVTPWTTDRDLPDIVFRACFAIVLSDRGQVGLGGRRAGPRGPGEWRATDRPPAARVRGWTGDMVGWTAFAQVAGTAKAAAPGLWPGFGWAWAGVGEVCAKRGRGAVRRAAPPSEALRRVLAAARRGTRPRQSLHPGWPRPPGPAPAVHGPERCREVGDPPPRLVHVPHGCREVVIRRPGGAPDGQGPDRETGGAAFLAEPARRAAPCRAARWRTAPPQAPGRHTPQLSPASGPSGPPARTHSSRILPTGKRLGGVLRHISRGTCA
jgi:hypothetical protein